MKPLIEKLPLSENSSFLARTYRTPLFEVPWHQHVEHELILITAGEGRALIGNSVVPYKTGDLYFLGSYLPHTFQKAEPDMQAAGIVIQFREDGWGEPFLQLPEMQSIRKLLQQAAQGLKINAALTQELEPLIRNLEYSSGFQRMLILFNCLHRLSVNEGYTALSTQEVRTLNPRHTERIDRIFQYTLAHFKDPVSLSAVAAEAGMSVTAFCSYFKKSTKKTYIDYLNELRIGHACQLLIESSRPVNDICYESGFNTLANFNKQFQKLKGLSPTLFRRSFRRAEGKTILQDASGRSFQTV